MDKVYNSQVSSHNPLKIWLIFFVYTVLVSCFIQFFVLRFIFPQWNDGNGLLTSSLDSKNFHSIAVELANRMHLDGWSVWELRPKGQAPAGIAAIFYYLFSPKPWVLIPLNAVLHASAAFILWKILNLFLKDRKKSLICVLPFLVFPSNLQWTAQLHKDGFSILGSALILYSSVSLAGLENLKDKSWYLGILRSLIYYIGGIFLIWLVRPFILIIMKFIMAPLLFLLGVVFLIRGFKGVLPWQRISVVLSALLAVFFVLSYASIKYRSPHFREYDLITMRSEKWLGAFAGNNIAAPEKKGLAATAEGEPEILPSIVLSKEIKESRISDSKKSGSETTKPYPVTPLSRGTSRPAEPRRFNGYICSVGSAVSISSRSVSKAKNIKIEPEKLTQKYITEYNWRNTPGLAPFIESKVYALAQMRGGFRFTAPEAKSNIDHDVGFGCFQDVLYYLPRAAQIAFLAPFPNQWFSKGSSPANSFMRKISAFEMIVVYFALIFLPFAIWYWRKRIEIWIIFIFCFSMLFLYGLVICNIGTLYRMRYHCVATIAALGIAGFIILLEQIKNKCAE